MLTLKICVEVFSEIFEARMLKLCIHMDNELINCGIENWTPCSYSSLYLSIFLSFTAEFVSKCFSGTVQAVFVHFLSSFLCFCI